MRSALKSLASGILLALFIAGMGGGEVRAADAPAAPSPKPAAPPKPPPTPPTYPDVAYGPDQAQVLDIYVPKGNGPFPVYFWIHGGGWRGGAKRGFIPELDHLLAAGVAVVSVEYRLVQVTQQENISPPVAGVLADNRHALQFVRLHAADWRLDPSRIVVGGSSAGACSALYLGCEGEKADPASRDPLEHESTKVLGVVADAAQASLDPRQMQAWLPGIQWGYWAFAEPDFAHFLADRDKWMPDLQRYSPDLLLTKDAPPILFSFSQTLPKPGEHPPPAQLVHSPLWGVGFQKLAQAKGVECYLYYPGHPTEKYGTGLNFILHQLGVDAKPPTPPASR